MFTTAFCAALTILILSSRALSIPDAKFGDSDFKLIVNPEDMPNDWEADRLRIQLFQKDELQKKLQLHKV